MRTFSLSLASNTPGVSKKNHLRLRTVQYPQDAVAGGLGLFGGDGDFFPPASD